MNHYKFALRGSLDHAQARASETPFRRSYFRAHLVLAPGSPRCRRLCFGVPSLLQVACMFLFPGGWPGSVNSSSVREESMGIDYNMAKLLLYCKKRGVDFSSVLTLGRQWIGGLPEDDLAEIAARLRLSLDSCSRRSLYASRFADELFRFLGAKTVHALDISRYEDADILHDLNTPISATYFNRYSIVIDGGTLEHVFNLPTAINNCMRMVANGGIFISNTVANNFMGHGFYQLSPELFFRVFDQGNGFKIERLFLCEARARCKWYDVPDPASVRRRVTLVNNKPIYMFVIARKLSDDAGLKTTPQQSDYANALWKGEGYARTSHGALKSAKRLVRRYAPEPLLRRAFALKERFEERRLYRIFDPYCDA